MSQEWMSFGQMNESHHTHHLKHKGMRNACACVRAYMRACVCACVRVCVRACICIRILYSSIILFHSALFSYPHLISQRHTQNHKQLHNYSYYFEYPFKLRRRTQNHIQLRIDWRTLLQKAIPSKNRQKLARYSIHHTKWLYKLDLKICMYSSALMESR